jgi:hypothetical protein
MLGAATGNYLFMGCLVMPLQMKILGPVNVEL